MKVLIVFELIPEEIRFYAIEADGEELEKIKAAHMRIGNTVDENEDKALWLGDFLERNCEKIIKNVVGKPIKGDFDLVVYSGFAM